MEEAAVADSHIEVAVVGIAAEGKMCWREGRTVRLEIGRCEIRKHRFLRR